MGLERLFYAAGECGQHRGTRQRPPLTGGGGSNVGHARCAPRARTRRQQEEGERRGGIEVQDYGLAWLAWSPPGSHSTTLKSGSKRKWMIKEEEEEFVSEEGEEQAQEGEEQVKEEEEQVKEGEEQAKEGEEQVKEREEQAKEREEQIKEGAEQKAL
uniref:Uncharacterized protein n=1 Tax=Knipowitschia caucasica TaxID=637954 RepID=A0AAV2J6Y4_KNICA